MPSGHLVQQRATSPTFDPIAFFAGTTEGNGRLKIMTKRRQQVMVTGRGIMTPDGGIVLDQDVRRGTTPPR